MEEKDAENIRKVLCKSFIQWFWELNLCSFKYQVNCLVWLHLSMFFCCCWSMLKWKHRNITKHLMWGPSGNQLVLFSLESWCFPWWTTGLSGKKNCFPRDLTLKLYCFSNPRNIWFRKNYYSCLLFFLFIIMLYLWLPIELFINVNSKLLNIIFQFNQRDLSKETNRHLVSAKLKLENLFTAQYST